jgi:hypothetical protein
LPVNFNKLFAQRNRGVLLDIVVFVLNVVLIRLLTRAFIELLRRAASADRLAKLELGLFFLAIFVLPATGAVLKRWHVHQRQRDRFKDWDRSGTLAGCLFHPAFYLAVSLCIAITAGVLLADQVFGPDFAKNPVVFLSLIFGAIVLSIIQTVLVYRYFSPPKHAPKTALCWLKFGCAGSCCPCSVLMQILIMWTMSVSDAKGAWSHAL